ncbi:MAG TPA: lytic transglycosylase domain-containing protein, partial [Nitrospirota bacterium]|nr:lytic transglycosylase domain-containing protein [Nitrospirota bacterium]
MDTSVIPVSLINSDGRPIEAHAEAESGQAAVPAVQRPAARPVAEFRAAQPPAAKPVPELKAAPAPVPAAPATPAQETETAGEPVKTIEIDVDAETGAELPAEVSPSDFIMAGDTVLVPVDVLTAAGLAPEAGNPVLKEAEKELVNRHDKSGSLFAPIENSIRYFSVTVKKHFSRYLTRSGKYMDMMKSILRENYLPEDLVFLALIESGFNPKAYSWAKASGPWQFIKGTATRYGLKVNSWVDERRDPVKSTKAAAAYLRDLYGMFGSWPLAMASYNCGEGNVARAVNRNGTLDFWELHKTRHLPSETKDYVPKFVAAKMIANDPEKYGFYDIEYDDPFEYEE